MRKFVFIGTLLVSLILLQSFFLKQKSVPSRGTKRVVPKLRADLLLETLKPKKVLSKPLGSCSSFAHELMGSDFSSFFTISENGINLEISDKDSQKLVDDFKAKLPKNLSECIENWGPKLKPFLEECYRAESAKTLHCLEGVMSLRSELSAKSNLKIPVENLSAVEMWDRLKYLNNQLSVPNDTELDKNELIRKLQKNYLQDDEKIEETVYALTEVAPEFGPAWAQLLSIELSKFQKGEIERQEYESTIDKFEKAVPVSDEADAARLLPFVLAKDLESVRPYIDRLRSSSNPKAVALGDYYIACYFHSIGDSQMANRILERCDEEFPSSVCSRAIARVKNNDPKAFVPEKLDSGIRGIVTIKY